jgi:L-serine dehydratase
LDRIWQVMQDCVQRGCQVPMARLPGGYQVKRRAKALHHALSAHPQDATDGATDERSPGSSAGRVIRCRCWTGSTSTRWPSTKKTPPVGRVVTAPTNGAAGIVPAVLHYYTPFCATAPADAGVQ